MGQTESKQVNFSHALAVSASVGALYGVAEGLLDLTVQHYHAAWIFPLAIVTGTLCFLLGGSLLAALCRLLPAGWQARMFAAGLGFALVYGLAPLASRQRLSHPVLFALTALGALLGAVSNRSWFSAAVVRVAKYGSVAALAAWSIVLVFTGSRTSHPRRSPTAGPNVLLVILDTVRADHLGSYGYRRPTSPVLDRLAAHGVLFETAISPSSWTLPAHASLLTGTYPHTHRTDRVESELPRQLPTVAEAFFQRGYRTAAFSGNRYFFTRRSGMGRGYQSFGDFFFGFADAIVQERLIAGLNHRLMAAGLVEDVWGRPWADQINRSLLRWLDRSAGPFFVTVNYFDAHDPYVPPAPWRGRFSSKPRPGGRLSIGTNHLPHLAPEELQDELDAYDGAIAYADHQLGQLLDELERRGLLANTLVVVTADHGELFGEHGLVNHANALWLPVIHVPLLFWWPGHLPAGLRIATPVSTTDVAATLLHLAGLPAGLPGEPLDALWEKPGSRPERPLPLSELAQLKIVPEFPDWWGPLVSVVSPQFQYIEDPRRGPLLFDWKADPGELHNLSGNPAYATALEQLQRLAQTRARTAMPRAALQ
jgi:arylsulfatase A-like enzyme